MEQLGTHLARVDPDTRRQVGEDVDELGVADDLVTERRGRAEHRGGPGETGARLPEKRRETFRPRRAADGRAQPHEREQCEVRIGSPAHGPDERRRRTDRTQHVDEVLVLEKVLGARRVDEPQTAQPAASRLTTRPARAGLC